MWFVYFNSVIGVIAFILAVLMSADYDHKFKSRYPDLEIPKKSTSGRIASVLKTLVGSFFPIINIGLLYVYVFESSKLEERVLQKLYEDCMKERGETVDG